MCFLKLQTGDVLPYCTPIFLGAVNEYINNFSCVFMGRHATENIKGKGKFVPVLK